MEIEFIKTDDWTELVIDGKRVIGNHSLSAKEVLKALGIEFIETWIDDEDAFNDYLNSKNKVNQD